MVEDSKTQKARNIGIDVPMPKGACNDAHCPFHGRLSVRGQILDGYVVSDRMDKTVVVRRDHLRYIPKYERFEKRYSKYAAHSPPCLDVKVGDKVRIMECRPLSKRVSFVVIENRGERP
ncbi:MAG: 30S ribosomal protein S17 [Candidatus Thermoplasmatota archaeon]